MKLFNSFSLSMTAGNGVIFFKKITPEQATSLFKGSSLESCVGHADTAVILSGLLKMPVPMNRVSTKLADKESFVVAQYMGPRLAEGVTTLPEGAEIQFLLLSYTEGL